MKQELNKLAPILVGVYDRLSHFKQCIESLQACSEATDSVLYVASDAAYKPEDTEKIQLVRDYIATINGFRQVVPIIREQNIGAVQNYLDARERVFESSESIILMEDDVVVGKGFLHFMNQGLELYKDNPKVVAVCGYLPPNIEKFAVSPFFLSRISAYGIGQWKEKENFLDQFRKPEFFDSCMRDYQFFKQFHKWSPNYVRALPLLIHGSWRLYDIENGVIMQRKNLLALFPPISITKSVGHDGTGLHSGVNADLQNQLISDEFYKVEKIEPSLNVDIMDVRGQYNKDCCVYLLNLWIFIMNRYFPKIGFFLFSKLRDFVRSVK